MGVRGWRLRYLGVFLLSAATLMFQVSYTRVLSVALWHHFVWMVVSIALLGYAVSGVLLTVLPGLREMDLDRAMTTLTVAFSVSIPLSHAALNKVPFDPSRLSWDRLQLLYVAVYYVILSIPFVLSGLVVTLALERSGERVNRLYFSNLTGSALGSFLVLFSFGPLTGSGVVVLSAILAGVSALAFTGARAHRLVLLSVGLLIPLYGLLFRDLHRLLDIPAQFRIIAVFIAILPLGILMGMPFPIGVRLISEANRESIPWAWAVNGCASVLGSIAPTILAFQLGFTSVFLCAGAAYLVNLVIISFYDGS